LEETEEEDEGGKEEAGEEASAARHRFHTCKQELGMKEVE